MTIYTKTGDDGTTSLYSGQRVSKHNLRVEAYGTVDELNAQLGMLRDMAEHSNVKSHIISIQHMLFSVGSTLASTSDQKHNLPNILSSDINFLEQEIDLMNTKVYPMTHFLLPGGHPVVSQCHIARSVCRRAERRISQLNENQNIDPIIIILINRLSDYLFVLGRFLAKTIGVEETKWIPEK